MGGGYERLNKCVGVQIRGLAGPGDTTSALRDPARVLRDTDIPRGCPYLDDIVGSGWY